MPVGPPARAAKTDTQPVKHECFDQQFDGQARDVPDPRKGDLEDYHKDTKDNLRGRRHIALNQQGHGIVRVHNEEHSATAQLHEADVHADRALSCRLEHAISKRGAIILCRAPVKRPQLSAAFFTHQALTKD